MKTFVSAIIDDIDGNFDVLTQRFIIAISAWNAAVIRERSEEDYLASKNTFLNIHKNTIGIEAMFDKLVTRKKELYNDVDFLYTKSELKLNNELECEIITVVTPYIHR